MLRRTFLAGSLTTLTVGALHSTDVAEARVTAVDEDFLTLLTNANQTQIPLVLANYRNASDSIRTVARKAPCGTGGWSRRRFRIRRRRDWTAPRRP